MLEETNLKHKRVAKTMIDARGTTSSLIRKDFWKKIGHFLKWRFPAVILVFLIFRILAIGIGNLRTPAVSLLSVVNEGNRVEISITELRIEPPDGTYIEAACYYQNKGVDSMVERRNFTKSGTIKWKLENDGMYFCDALHGKIGSLPGLSTKDFPVYGDYVSEESSVWLVDFRGRRRIESNGIQSQDFIGRWHHYPQSQYD